MQLLLLRHGIAERAVVEPGLGLAQADARRPLSAAGRVRTMAVLRRLVDLNLQAAQLCSSPLLRARQTAELAVAAGLAPSLQLVPSLAPGGAALDWLRQHTGAVAAAPAERLILVGHEPDLSSLAAALIGAPLGCLELKKAGVIVLQWQPPAGWATLQWLVSPRLLLA
jgi:phosphohistidine phosphatase